jgi:hypothetical protein
MLINCHEKKLIKAHFAGTLFFASCCVSLTSKLNESSTANSQAAVRGFTASAQEAARLKQKEQCAPKDSLKWELKFDETTPLIQQNELPGVIAYGPHYVICFSAKSSGQTKIRLTTKHQGGGYSKAYYILPYFFLYNQKNQLIKPNEMPKISQTVWSGDYVFDANFPLQKDQIFYLVVESNNMLPDRPWKSYPNYGMGAAGELFSINVYSSVYGVIDVEIVP